nr:MAG TPA: hypothetical protein [Caudoviricetes sp.]
MIGFQPRCCFWAHYVPISSNSLSKITRVR